MSERRRRPARLGPAGDGGLLLVSLAAGIGLCRLTTDAFGTRAVLPVAFAVVAGHVAVALVRRIAIAALASVAGLVGVFLACTWWFVPGASFLGVPTPASAVDLARSMGHAGSVIRAQATPVPATSGVLLCVAAGAGLAAVLARSIVAWRGAGHGGAFLALVPSAGLFAYASLLSSEIDRLPAALAYISAVLLYLALSELADASGRSVVRARLLAGAVLGMGVAIAVPLVASPALGGLRLDAVPFSVPVGEGSLGLQQGPNPGGVDALTLIDDLRAVLTDRADQVLYTARTAEPTYWQVATLTTFDGTRWLPDPATVAAATTGVVPSRTVPLAELPVAAPAGIFATAISVLSWHSTLVPVPPGTANVPAAEPLLVLPSIGVLQRQPTTPGEQYGTESPLALAPTGPVVDDEPPSVLAPYLALPAVAPAVRTLARNLVAGSSNPLDEAFALAHYFHSGRFRYTLNPAAVPGTDPLSAFLFRTRAGFCQQFAAAFAVLARLDGLPTRLAVGFTAGTQTARGSYNVTGADAHVWPQVYLGRTHGWVSFEPTPAAGSGTNVPGVLTTKAPTEGTSQRALGPTTTVAPIGLPTVPLRASSTVPPARRAVARRHGGSPLPWLLPLLALALVVGGIVAWRRHPAWVLQLRSRFASPPEAVVLAWRAAEVMLARRLLGRRPQETVGEHAGRVAEALPEAGGAYRELSELAVRASYCSQSTTAHDVLVARRLHGRVCRAASQRPQPRTGRVPAALSLSRRR